MCSLSNSLPLTARHPWVQEHHPTPCCRNTRLLLQHTTMCHGTAQRSSHHCCSRPHTTASSPVACAQPTTAAHLLGEVADSVVVCVGQEVCQAVPVPGHGLGVVHQPRAKAPDLLVGCHCTERNLAQALGVQAHTHTCTHPRSKTPGQHPITRHWVARRTAGAPCACAPGAQCAQRLPQPVLC